MGRKRKSSALDSSITDRTKKYFGQRYRLFSRYDEGVRLDEEGWFSVTPENIAKHIAERCKCNIIVDGFVGVGGNAIQFALTGAHGTITLLFDSDGTGHAKHNAEIYGVADRIEFIQADFTQWIQETNLTPDVIFLSPPWGGPEYVQAEEYTLDMIPLDGYKLFELARRRSTNIVYFLPRTTRHADLLKLPAGTMPFEIEENYLYQRPKSMTVYWGDLFTTPVPKDQERILSSDVALQDISNDYEYTPVVQESPSEISPLPVTQVLSNKERARQLRLSLRGEK